MKLTIWLDVDFKKQIVAYFGATDLPALERADGHQARRRWSRICDCSGSGDHADVEAERHCPFAGAVDALDVVRARSVCDESRMFLDHKDEGSLALRMNSSD